MFRVPALAGTLNESLIIGTLKPGCLDVLEIRGSGRQTVDVQECRIEYPVTLRWTVNVNAALKRSVIIVRVVEIDQRAAVVETNPAPVFQESLEVMYAAVHV